LIRHNQILARNGIDPSGTCLSFTFAVRVCLTGASRDATGFQGRDTAMNDERFLTSTFIAVLVF